MSIFRCVTLFVFTLHCLLLPASGQNTFGLDPTFNGNGVGSTAFAGEVGDIALQSDGKIVVVGKHTSNGMTDAGVARYNSDGTLDRSFSGDGKVFLDYGGNEGFNSVAIDSKGNILCAGSSEGTEAYSLIVVRLKSDGSPDSSFGNAGKVSPTNFYGAADLGIVEGEKVIVACLKYFVDDFTLLRLNGDGSLDTSFGNQGEAITDFGYSDHIEQIQVQKDGKIVACGIAVDTDKSIQPFFCAFARYTAEGQVDRSFGSNGKTIFLVGQQSLLYDIQLQPDGKIVAVGSVYPDWRILVVRLTPSGALDRDFHGTGIRELNLTSSGEFGSSVVIQNDGRIVIGGRTDTFINGNQTFDFLLTRLETDGRIDYSFDDKGYFLTDFGKEDYLTPLALQPDGRLVVGGVSQDDIFPPIPGKSLVVRYKSTYSYVPTLRVHNATAKLEGSSIAAGQATFEITLTPPPYKNVTVNYHTEDIGAKADQDYVAASGTLVFAPGEASKTVSVNFIGDAVPEASEAFYLYINTPQTVVNGGFRAWGIITNDDGPRLSISNAASVTEGNNATANAIFTVTLSAPSAQTVVVNAIPSNGTAKAPQDYGSAGQTLRFAPGETTKTFVVPIQGDLLDEKDETFFVLLSSPVNAGIERGRGMGLIKDNDLPPSLSINDVTITEGDSNSRILTFNVALSAASGQAVNVNYATSDGTARLSSDYAPKNGTLSFAPNRSSISISIEIKGDTLVEGNETFFIFLSGAVNASIGKARGVGTILNDDSSG